MPYANNSLQRALQISAAFALFCNISHAQAAITLPEPSLNEAMPGTSGNQTIVLAGGCFWGVEAVFEHVKGVTRAMSGYAGGSAETADYKIVSKGATNHAEAVEVTYDPTLISAGKLLQIFFSVAHDPTQLNRQGPDKGTQYRSAVFFTTPEQEKVAKAYIAQLDQAKAFPTPIVTQVNSLVKFYPAEDYHQDYARLHPTHPYIVFHDLPKVADLKKYFSSIYKEE